MVQWLRICLLMQGTWVPSLVGQLRFHVLRGKQACMSQLERRPHTTMNGSCVSTQSQCSQINIFLKKSIDLSDESSESVQSCSPACCVSLASHCPSLDLSLLTGSLLC